LNDFLNEENYKKKLKNKYDSALILEWDNLRKILWNNNCIVSPTKFIKTIQKVAELKNMETFIGYSQNDLSEFLLFLIDCFHNSISREINMNISGNPENQTDELAIKCFEMIKEMYSKEYSEIWNMFYGIHVSQLVCLKTDKILQQKPEPYFIIDLPIPQDNKNPSLIDCFELYVEGEILEGDNAWYCEDIKEKIDIKKNIVFWSFPNILVIDLKRFKSNNEKNKILVNFTTEDLDLSKYIVGYKKNTFVYELYGICNHYGSVYGGHYTSFVKNSNGKWYYFNDTQVSEVGQQNSIITPNAYVLFYKKKQIS
jgi:ubiquitin carboxyl-terminal hydrolase 8